jgi:hypothetical protein
LCCARDLWSFKVIDSTKDSSMYHWPSGPHPSYSPSSDYSLWIVCCYRKLILGFFRVHGLWDANSSRDKSLHR